MLYSVSTCDTKHFDPPRRASSSSKQRKNIDARSRRLSHKQTSPILQLQTNASCVHGRHLELSHERRCSLQPTFCRNERMQMAWRGRRGRRWHVKCTAAATSDVCSSSLFLNVVREYRRQIKCRRVAKNKVSVKQHHIIPNIAADAVTSPAIRTAGNTCSRLLGFVTKGLNDPSTAARRVMNKTHCAGQPIAASRQQQPNCLSMSRKNAMTQTDVCGGHFQTHFARGAHLSPDRHIVAEAHCTTPPDEKYSITAVAGRKREY